MASRVTKGYPVSVHYERLPSLAPAPRIDSHLELYAKLSVVAPAFVVVGVRAS
jgi:hypothetical protein